MPDVKAALQAFGGRIVDTGEELSREALDLARRWQHFLDARAQFARHLAGCETCDDKALRYCPKARDIISRRFDAFTKALAVTGAVRLDVPPITCYTCKGQDWWVSSQGAVICARCHPPPPGLALWRLVPWGKDD